MAEAAAAEALTKWAREYETIYILRPDVTTEEAEKVSTRVAETIERLNGRMTKVDNWGKRRLAYVIQKHTRGIFIYVRYVGFNDLVVELERNLRLLDTVVRFQTILLREMVNPAEVEVDPEETKFVPIEQSTEEEPQEPDAAQRLGMYYDESRSSRAERPEEEAVAEEEDGSGDRSASEEDE